MIQFWEELGKRDWELLRIACNNCGLHVLVVYLDDQEELRGVVDKRDAPMMCACLQVEKMHVIANYSSPN